MPIPSGKLAEILDVAEDGIITVDSRQQIVLFNRGATKLFGYEPEEALGKSLDLLIPQKYLTTHRGDVETFARGPVISRAMLSLSKHLFKRIQEFHVSAYTIIS